MRQLGVVEGKKRKYVSTTTIANTKSKAPAKHWPKEEWYALLMHLQKEGLMKVADTAETGSREEKQWRQMKADGNAEQAAAIKAVRLWAKKKTAANPMGVREVLPGQAKDAMGAAKRTGTVPRIAVAAAMAYLAYAGEMQVTMSPQGEGGKKRDWKQDIARHMDQAGWMNAEEAQKVVEAVTVAPYRAATILDIGEGWRGTRDGMMQVQGVDRVIGTDCEGHYLGNRGYTMPEVLARFEEFEIGKLVEGICSRGGSRESDVIGVWASPSCKEYSTGNGIGKKNGKGKGKFGGTQLTTKEKEALTAVMRGLHEWHTKDPQRNHYFLENPAWGSMRFEEEVKTRFGEGKILNGCAYGLLHKKPYRYWTSIPAKVWTPRDSKAFCEACRKGCKHAQVMCAKKGDLRPGPSIPGYSKKAARNRIPPELAKEIGAAFVRLSAER